MAEELGIFATDSGGSFETPEAGSYIARCYRMIDLGTLPQQFEGKPAKPARKVMVYWELLEDEDGEPVRMEDGRPFSVSQEYTLSTNAKANLRRDIDAWRGKALTDEEAKSFNITKLLDKFCRLNIVINDKGYPQIKGVSATKKRPDSVNPESWWSVTNPDMDVYEKFPEWLRNKIATAQEWGGKDPYTGGPAKEVGDEDEDVDVDDLQF